MQVGDRRGACTDTPTDEEPKVTDDGRGKMTPNSFLIIGLDARCLLWWHTWVRFQCFLAIAYFFFSGDLVRIAQAEFARHLHLI